MDYKGLETPYLVDRCVVRDPLAWAEFVTRFSALIDFAVKRMLSRFSGETYEEAAKDIKQDVLMSVWSEERDAELSEGEKEVRFK